MNGPIVVAAGGVVRRRGSLVRGFLTAKANRRLVVVGAIAAAICILAVVAPYITPFPPNASTGPQLGAPSFHHWFGTDQFGRDVFSRVLAGTRVSISVGVGAVLVGLIVGSAIGIAAGKREGSILDQVLMRLMDMILSFPLLVLAAVLSGLTEGRTLNVGPVHLNQLLIVLLVIGLVLVPVFGRIARASAMAEAKEEYVLAARAAGVRNRTILLREVLPNVAPPLIVQATIGVGLAIVAEAALSFLGLGIEPPQASWGNILQTGQNELLLGGWWLIVFPTVAIGVTTFTFMLLGDSLRDHLDPSAGKALPVGAEAGLVAAQAPAALTSGVSQ